MAGLGMKYFVLKPEGNTDHARASRTAMRVFAAEIHDTDSKLATQLKQWAYEEERKLNTEDTANENREVEGDY